MRGAGGDAVNREFKGFNNRIMFGLCVQSYHLHF